MTAIHSCFWIGSTFGRRLSRSGTHPIPLLEIINKTGGTIEFWDFFSVTVLRQKCLNGNIARHLVTENGLGSIDCE
jgi:hypothetical protein